jgi:hypothetical protein
MDWEPIAWCGVLLRSFWAMFVTIERFSALNTVSASPTFDSK